MNEGQTRLDTDDLDLWRQAGLSGDENGLILSPGTGPDSRNLQGEGTGNSLGYRSITSDHTQSGMLGIENIMQEDMISNALVWLSSRLCNFIATGEGFVSIPAGDRSESLQEDGLRLCGKSQKSLLEKWNRLAREQLFGQLHESIISEPDQSSREISVQE